MKTKNKKRMSLVLGTILIGSIGLAGCGGDNDDVVTPTSKNISGVVIDGYVKQSTVTLNGLTTQTDDLGAWSIPYSGNNSDVITAKGGFDISTTKPFEGTLKAEIDDDGINIVVTPISTLVSSLVKNGATKGEANAKIASQLGISEATLGGDFVTLLLTGTSEEKVEAAKVMKTILIVQKTAEAFAKSMGNNESANYDATFEAVYEVIATKLNSANFETVMGDTSSIATALKINLAPKVTDALLDEKLDAASSSAENIFTSINSISSDDIQNKTNSVAKAVEQLTTLIENKLVEIGSAENNTTINTAKINADTVFSDSNITSLVVAYDLNSDLPIANSQSILVVTSANSSTYDANTTSVSFNFTAGTYTYTIANFNDGDVLNFPDGNTATIINESFTDGRFTVQWADNGNVITVILSNIPTADDEMIYGATSFNTAFGAGSIQ